MTLFGFTFSVTVMGYSVGTENYITKEEKR